MKTSGENTLLSANVTLDLLNDVPVEQTIYGKSVKLQGQTAEMNITSFESYHVGNYSLRINNKDNFVSAADFVIKASGKQSLFLITLIVNNMFKYDDM